MAGYEQIINIVIIMLHMEMAFNLLIVFNKVI